MNVLEDDLGCTTLENNEVKLPDEGGDSSTQAEVENKKKRPITSCHIPVSLLSRFIHATGSIGLRQLLHLDVQVFNEMKRRNYIREERENKKKLKKGRRSFSALEASRKQNQVMIMVY